jgi:hypothetical protein
MNTRLNLSTDCVFITILLGINVHKAQHMEGALSNLLKTNREQTKSTIVSSSISNSSTSRQTDATHAWLLVHCMYSLIFKIEIL